MSLGILGLSITYVALAAMVLAIFLFTRIPTKVKLICVILVSVFYYITFFSLQELLGSPTKQELPEKFKFLSASVVGPNDKTGDPGRIYIWLNVIIDNQLDPKPKAYSLPYNLELHASVDAALEKLRSGKKQLGRPKKEGKNAQQRTSSQQVSEKPAHYGKKDQQVEFYDIPTPELPEK
jgi:hypothetical protein